MFCCLRRNIAAGGGFGGGRRFYSRCIFKFSRACIAGAAFNQKFYLDITHPATVFLLYLKGVMVVRNERLVCVCVVRGTVWVHSANSNQHPPTGQTWGSGLGPCSAQARVRVNKAGPAINTSTRFPTWGPTSLSSFCEGRPFSACLAMWDRSGRCLVSMCHTNRLRCPLAAVPALLTTLIWHNHDWATYVQTRGPLQETPKGGCENNSYYHRLKQVRWDVPSRLCGGCCQ